MFFGAANPKMTLVFCSVSRFCVIWYFNFSKIWHFGGCFYICCNGYW